MEKKRIDNLLQRILQVVAILGLALIVGVILHKGYTDVTRLAKEHGGGGFLPALARYVFRNLAGG